ncbi:Hypothetical Protein FCC1311_073442 [Hondaea fermentalgiana]|uniref:Uncharacterized protein n=1 Tax=Hondaea fermentalgiana TaxID=2315210 RepID=A0A2R5GR68_9STRA|nr:Hypothetical Protein FCC1311_073442 [Hondaea fermentalgiana]|eukprot:GBG31123.1 Hypothetical Protein FCC1311_073442 [Hondaea fermentalgiana]
MAPTLKGVTAALVRNLLELLRTPPVEVADVRKLGELVRRDPVALHHALGKDLAPALVTCLQGRATFEILRVLDFISKASSRGRSEVRAALRPRKLSTIIRKRPRDLECCHLAIRLLCLVARGPHAKALTSGDLEPVLQSMVKFGKEAPVLAADACRFTFLYLETLGENFTAIIRALKSGGASPDDVAADKTQAFEPDAALLPLTQVEGLYALARNLLVEGDILTMLANTFRHVEAPLKRMVRAGVLAISAFGRSRLSKHFLKIFRVSETADPRDKRMNSLFEVYKGAISFTPVSDIDSSSATSYGLDSFPTDLDAQSQESGDDLAVDAPAMTFTLHQDSASEDQELKCASDLLDGAKSSLWTS